MNRRTFFTAIAALPLPLTIPWIDRFVRERQPKFDAPPTPKEVRCACGEFALTPEIQDIQDILVRFDSGPVEWAWHRREECFVQNREAGGLPSLTIYRVHPNQEATGWVYFEQL